MKALLYERVLGDLRQKIGNRSFGPEGRIPSEKELCEQYNVSSITIKRAMRELSQKGLVVRRPRLGTFAADAAMPTGGVSTPTKLRSLVFIAPYLKDELDGTVLHGLSLAAGESDVRVQVKSSLNCPMREAELLAAIPTMGIDGAIILPVSGHANTERFFALKLTQQMRFVFVDRYFDGLDVPHVVNDDADAGYQLTKLLIEKGHRRIAFVGEGLSVVSVRLRYQGYMRALQEQGIAANGTMVRLVEPYVDVKEGQRRDTSVEREGYRQMLSMADRPTAVVAANNYHARTLIDVAEELDLHVPKDISIVGMGGSQTAESIRPTLTFARQNFEVMGQEAFLALQRLIEQPGEVRHSIIPAEIEPGRSVQAIGDVR